MNKKQKEKILRDVFYSVLDGKGDFHKSYRTFKKTKKKGVKNDKY